MRSAAVPGAALVAIVAVTAVGCGGTAGLHRTAPARSSSAAPAGATATRPATPAPPTAGTPPPLAPGSAIALGADTGPAAVEGDTLAYPLSHGGDWDRVVAASLSTGRRHEVARTRFPAGLINRVALAGRWVVYVDQSARQSDTAPRVLWRVVAVRPGTDRRIVLTSNRGRPDPYVPIVRSRDGHVFWTRAEHDRTAREQVWEPGWAEPRDVLRHVEMTPGSGSISGHRLVYLGRAATGATGHTVGGDCWSVPLTGGVPRALTHTALAMWCGAGDDALAWTLHIDPTVQPHPADGILDDPYELWAATGGGEPHRLRRGYFSMTDPAVGGGDVAWLGYGTRLTLQSAAHPSVRASTPAKSVQQVMISHGKLVYITRQAAGDTAHVTTLPPPR